MTGLRIDYSDLTGLVDEGVKKSQRKKQRRDRARSVPRRAAHWAAVVAVLAVLPFALLIRGGVFAYQEWGLNTWLALTLSAVASAGLLGLYGWAVTRRLGAGPGVRKVVSRAAIGVGIAYVVYGVVVIASENVKTDDIREQYSAVHPLLRIAARLAGNS